MGTTVVTVDSTVVNVALPAIRDDLGGGFAGQQWTANAYLVTLASLILVGGSLGDIFGERRVFSLGVGGLRRDLDPVRGRPDDRGAGARPRAPGRGGRAAHTGGAGGDRRGVPRGRARQGGRRLDRLGGDRRGDRAAGRRPARGLGVVAVDLRHQRAAGARHDVADRPGGAGGPRRAGGREGRRDSARLLCAVGLAGITFGLIRQPEVGSFGDPTRRDAAVRRHRSRSSRSSSTRRARRTRCCRSSSFAGATSPSATSRRSRCTPACRCCSSSSCCSSRTPPATARWPRAAPACPVTIVMFLTSMRFGALADRYGPRFFMGVGPIVAERRPGAAHPARGRPRLPDRPAPGAADLRRRACR